MSFVTLLIQFCYSSLCMLVFSFPFLTHPLAMGITLLMTTVLIALMMGTVYSSYWLPYCLVLILLGGLLVIFIYVSLLASNETFRFSPAVGILVFLTFPLSLYPLFISEASIGHIPPLAPFDLTQGVQEVTMYDTFSSLYSSELNSLTIFIVLYLLLSLLVVVFNTKSSTSTLRSQKN